MSLTLRVEKPCSTCLSALVADGWHALSHMYSLCHQNYRNYWWANLLKRKFSNVFTFYLYLVPPLNSSSLLPILAPWMSSSPSPWLNSYSRVCCHTFPLWHQTAMIPLYLGPPFLVLQVSPESGQSLGGGWSCRSWSCHQECWLGLSWSLPVSELLLLFLKKEWLDGGGRSLS